MAVDSKDIQKNAMKNRNRNFELRLESDVQRIQKFAVLCQYP